MNFTLAEEQEMLKKMARDFLADKCPKTLVKEVQADAKGCSPELWQEMAGLGWMGLVLPEKFGGSAMSFLDLAVLLEEMGRAALPGPFISTVVTGALPILEFGTDEQKQKYLPGISEGKTIFTLALTEPGGNPNDDLGSISVKASPDRDGYVINGIKLFVPDAHIADFLLCFARTDEQAAVKNGHNGLTAFILDVKSPGISKAVLKTIGSDKLCEVVFDNLRVPKENILGKLNQGRDLYQKMMPQAAVAKSCIILGSIQQMLEMTVAYAKERVQYDKPIGSFQVIQHYCANMATDVDGLRFAVYQAAWKLSEGLPCLQEAAIAKVWANEAFGRVSTLAHQIHGAIGVTIDHDLQFYTKQGAAAALSFGSSDGWREAVAWEMGL
ncbi:MAG: acyl-CoA/acyl-ACP dehydrogenase [Chloroflexi bacterium]|nr:acyl-CoA/acyl-ACP dehydrogenase [Chloroflexota bacterium]